MGGNSLRKNDGHVITLDLRTASLVGADGVESSLVLLTSLKHLDLSGNDFGFHQIPNFLGSMKQLRYLNLSDANFGGKFPPDLGNLTELLVLDLSHNNYDPMKSDEDMKWVNGLLSLQHIDMGGVDLGKALNVMYALNTLPLLLSLSLSGCRLECTHLSYAPVNSSFFPAVELLDLSSNDFNCPIPYTFQNMTSLRVLDLSGSSFNSSVPFWLGTIKTLVHVDLSVNSLNGVEGGLISIIKNTCDLKFLSLSFNQLQGDIFQSHENFSGCIKYEIVELSLGFNQIKGSLADWFGQLEKLKHLDICNNSLEGRIPSSFGNLLSLEILYLFDNELTGPIPTSIGKLSKLRELDLSNNYLNGVLPESLGQLGHLEQLIIPNNLLEGEVTEVHFSNLSRLNSLWLSENYLTLKMKSNWVPTFHLNYIQMRSCKINGELPQWLQTQTKAQRIDLSNNSIIGSIPSWLRNLTEVSNLDLSDNHISGPFPRYIADRMTNLVTFNIAGNLLNGSIPNSFCNMIHLLDLDLSENLLTGHIPNCWGHGQLVTEINLSWNRLSGVIPISIGNLTYLEKIQLSNNYLHGELPISMRNCTSLSSLDLGENELLGSISFWIGESLSSLLVLRLKKNKLHGILPQNICLLSHLKILDISDNNLMGTIPPCLGNLQGMRGDKTDFSDKYSNCLRLDRCSIDNVRQVIKGRDLNYTNNLKFVVNMDLSSNKLVGPIPKELTHLISLVGLNLSHNHLSGEIPEEIGAMKSLESLDLSNNQLSGLMPITMPGLTSLAYLNLSYNNLSGRILQGNQLLTFNDPSIYVGNPNLCGAPLPKKCPGEKANQTPTWITPGVDKEHKEDKFEKMWLYIIVMAGFATGFWGIFGVLVLNKSWRHAYFRHVNETTEKIIVFTLLNVARFKKLMKGKPE